MRSYGIMILVVGFFCKQAVCLAQTISSSEAIAHAKDLDGRTVTYSGEVIGEVMMRGSNAWINVNDGKNAVGVWIPSALTAGISRSGGFKYGGDTVEVTGVLHRACVEHGGDLDIHAQAIRIVSPGTPRMTCSLNKVKKDWVIKLLGVVAIVWILTLLKIR